MDIQWKKVAGGDSHHDQWEAVGLEAIVRESCGWYDVYLNGKRVSSHMTLRLAKKAIASRLQAA